MRLIDMQPYIQLDNLPGEIWKEHQYFSNLFVSTFGRIKRSGNKYTIKNGGYNIVNDHILKLREHIKGYYYVEFKYNGIRYRRYAHRLVAETFINNSNVLCDQVNHIDENKHNNRVENLEWCTAYYNSNYGTKPQRLSNATKGKQAKNRKSITINGVTYDSITAACNQLNKSFYTIKKLSTKNNETN